jgi:hypothetical protein
MIIGRRASGKTILIKNILHHMKSDRVLLFDSSPLDEYRNIVPEECKYVEYNDDIMVKMGKLVSATIMKNGHDMTKVPSTAIIFGEELDQRDKTGPGFKNMIFNGKMYKYNVLLQQQTPILQPQYRQQIDYLFLSKETNSANLRKIYDQWVSQIFDTYNIFTRILNDCTRNYGFMVVDFRSRSYRLSERVFRYKVQANICILESTM